MIFENLFRYEMFIVAGLFMAVLSLIKLLGGFDFSSDWFWFIAGVGLVIEGGISFYKQKMFNKKYKVVLRRD